MNELYRPLNLNNDWVMTGSLTCKSIVNVTKTKVASIFFILSQALYVYR